MTSLNNQAQIGRECASITGTGSLLIGVWGWHVVRKFSGTLKHFALRIWAVGVFNLLGHGFHFIGGMGDANQITPGNAVERVAGGTDFTVDLVSTSDTIE